MTEENDDLGERKARTYCIMSDKDLVAGKEQKPWTKLEIIGSVKNLSPAIWDMTHLTHLYLNDNNIQRLPPDIGKLTNLEKLDLSNNKLRTLPAEIGELLLLKILLLNDNNLRTLPFELGKLFRLESLGLKGNSLGNDLLQLYKEPKGLQKLLSYLLDILSIQEPVPRPSPRPWIMTGQPADKSKPSCMFTVMCYNVLCDRYATRQLYGYCPSWALKWQYRRASILEELKSNSADVIALQEVATEQYYKYFLEKLEPEGYGGVFSPKSRAKTMSSQEKKYVDGCAIFYKTSKFSLVSEHLIEFNQLAMANSLGSDDMLNRVMTKDNIALAAVLQINDEAFQSLNASGESASNQPSVTSNGPNVGGINVTQVGSNGNTTSNTTTLGCESIPLHQQRLLVCTAQIHWNPEFCDVKIVQTIMLTHELQTIAMKAAKDLIAANGDTISKVQSKLKSYTNQNQSYMNRQQLNNLLDTHEPNSTVSGDDHRLEQLCPDLIPIVLCGDFNSLPDSGVLEFLTNGSISADHKDFKALAYKDCLRKICDSRTTASANSQHSQQQNQTQQYSGQSSKSSPISTTISSSSESSVDDQLKSTFDDALNNGNGNQRKAKSGLGQAENSDSNEINYYTHPFYFTSTYSVHEKAMPFTNYV